MNIASKILGAHPAPTGQIADGLYAARTRTVNFYALKTPGGTVLFDSGYGRAAVLRELRRLGVGPAAVTHVFLTHSDFDHAGGLRLFPNAQVYLSKDEEPLALRQMARMLGVFHNRRIRTGYALLADGDEAAIGAHCVRAVATPGHTPGSMSYLLDGTILFTGDTVRIEDGKILPVMHYVMDMARQRESVRKVAEMKNIRLICTGHSGWTHLY